ncbi:peptidoglycan-binding protein [Aliiglaciecola lipolytica]|uniref:Peptidoglycan binding domain-containing protein n=1 Tax=Aliiglaciecola lipolytica E3 TaxID=1127673 RepID=K6YUF3_9ALTE|nr:peptidoglycan-binding protein [Aliiglaciecola lipolytica]GAC14915.1 peptidoglycan binding domain-containing protein [Aliiglaciecola lipolytica E3]
MIPVDGDFILKIAPRFSGDKAEAQMRIVSDISAIFAPTLASYQINTPLRIAHFMGQVTHECAGFRTTEEFASGAAYEGRADLGNDQPGDGKRYKGRGLLQLTGRANYRKYGKMLNLPLEDDPQIAADPAISLKIACEYWKSRDINAAADMNDLIRVTKLVNGGRRGLEDRRKYFQKAKMALAGIEGIRIALEQGEQTVVLRRGSFGEKVGELQSLLVAKGFVLSIDEDFGSATEGAVSTFQKNNGISPDGIVGNETWKKLRA